MIWLALRQARAQLVAAVAVAIAGLAALAVTGSHLRALARTSTDLYTQLPGHDRTLFYAGIITLALAPALLGVFWGAPLIARELENGTHRLVWTQSVSRRRWLVTRLGLTALPAAAVVGALSWAITRWSDPMDGLLSKTHGSLPSRLTPVSFAMRGIVPISYTIFALVLGALVGAIVRRTLPAMALTLAVYVAVQVAVPLWVRPHVAPTVDQTIVLSTDRLDGLFSSGPGTPVQATARSASSGDWILTNHTIDAQGRSTQLPAWFDACLPSEPAGPSTTPSSTRASTRVGLQACFTRLADEGYRQHLVYQPVHNFWRLQWTESGLFLLLSAGLAWCTSWWTRRRLC